MLENAAEYWAEGCQSWFDATVSDTVQCGPHITWKHSTLAGVDSRPLHCCRYCCRAVQVRTDVNSGINTREKLKAHDPCFAELLAEVGSCLERLGVCFVLIPD